MAQQSTNYNEVRGNEIKEMLIYLTSQCQLKCTHCYLDKEKTVKQLTLQDLDWLTKTFEIKNVNFLGGEPLLYPYIKEAIQMFDNVTISTNGIVLSLDNSRSKELIDVFKSKGKKFSVQLSIQGNESDTNEIRGPGVWEKVLTAAKLLKKNDISCIFVSNYSTNNIGHLPKVIDDICHPLHIPLVLFPEIGKNPLTTEEQKWLFSMIMEKNKQYNEYNFIDQPNFFQWLNQPGRCKAGSERLALTYNKELIPCHMDFDYCLGEIGTPVPIINENRRKFLKTGKITQEDCLFCSKAGICRSGCYISNASQGCPLKTNYTLERYAYVSSTDKTSLDKQISNMKGLLRGSAICP